MKSIKKIKPVFVRVLKLRVVMGAALLNIFI